MFGESFFFNKIIKRHRTEKVVLILFTQTLPNDFCTINSSSHVTGLQCTYNTSGSHTALLPLLTHTLSWYENHHPLSCTDMSEVLILTFTHKFLCNRIGKTFTYLSTKISATSDTVQCCILQSEYSMSLSHSSVNSHQTLLSTY
jgi:hypothetical protein